jgi:D-3-phosphoglycerate dehydrogenase
VFQTEPAKESPLFGTPNFISTPHLGASTNEAQVNVALQVAEQMADLPASPAASPTRSTCRRSRPRKRRS